MTKLFETYCGEMRRKKIIVSVTNDITTDQRVNKICNTLVDIGFEVTLVGVMRAQSQKLQKRPFQTKRLSFIFSKGPFFYANYNIRLFFYLLFLKHDALWSNDLDSLLANYLVSVIRKKRIIFDSHEYFTEVPELVNRPRVKKIWKTLERLILPRLKDVLTVSPSIVTLYKNEYNIDAKLLRNVPFGLRNIPKVENIRKNNKKILLYQGAVNVNRGIEYMVKSMRYIDNAILYILGKGDVYNDIKSLISELHLEEKIKMLGEIPLEKLAGYTVQADLGLSLEEDMGLNYRFALPNKLFNYIQAGLPVLVSYLPEMKNLVQHYDVGKNIEKHDEKHIADMIKGMIEDDTRMATWRENSRKAAKELNWENEKHVIESLF